MATPVNWISMVAFGEMARKAFDTRRASPDLDDRNTVIQRERNWHEHKTEGRNALDAFLYDAPAFESVIQCGLSFLRADTNQRVLDIGCGEGKDTLALAGQYQSIISIDLSFAQIARARQLLSVRAPGTGVCFVQANAEQLPFAPGSF